VPLSPAAGQLVTETLDYDGGREVTAYVPSAPPEAIVFAGDGQLIAAWGGVLEAAGLPPTMIIGAHCADDDALRIKEYAAGDSSVALAFDPERFAAHEAFFVEQMRGWARSRFEVALPAERTAVFGVSAGAELALAMALRHPDLYGAVLCASPGAGYRPPAVMPSPLPRAYLVAGRQEPFFLENAIRWADALRDAGAEVVMVERDGSHGDAFWQQEFPLMVAWAFGHGHQTGGAHRAARADATSPRTTASANVLESVNGSRVAEHLADCYGITVTATAPLDVGVLRVDRADGPSWVARVFSHTRPLAEAAGDAEILRLLEQYGFPAERCAVADPVSTLDGRPVLVTGFVEPAAPLRPGRSAALLGGLLGALSAHPADGLRAGGAWHHLSPTGGPPQEIAAARERLEEHASRVGLRELGDYHRLCDLVEHSDDCSDLPHAFVHPDFVLANAIPTADERLVIVDWAGAGRGPRLWAIGFLLWAAGSTHPRLLELVSSRYRRHVTLEHSELARLDGAIGARPTMIECWSLCVGRQSVADTLTRVREIGARAERLADHARRELSLTSG
jgi:Phosphotransferase enzyme family/Putative esterase